MGLVIFLGIILGLFLFFKTSGFLAVVLGIAIVIGFSYLLHSSSINYYNRLSGGFDAHRDQYLPDQEMLEVLVQEELDQLQLQGRYLHPKRTHCWRAIYTAAYIILNFFFLAFYYYRHFPHWMTIFTLLYIFLYHCCDPLAAVCKAVRAQPDQEISQIVAQATREKPPRNRMAFGFAAFALSLLLFFVGNATPRFEFTAVDGGYCLTDYSPGIPLRQQVEIPETHQGQPVVAIGDQAFANIFSIREIIIPESVTHIGSYAFQNCRNLTEIQLPAGLKTLNGGSFTNCVKLRSITIPLGVTEIRGNTFENCESLETVALHDGIIDIHAYAFYKCKSLKKITLPSSIKEIHTYCFAECDALQSIVIPDGVTRIAARAFYECNKLKNVEIPDSVLEIRSSAFRSCDSLHTITLPKGIKVDEKAFKDTNVTIHYK